MKKVFFVDDDVFVTRLYENLLNTKGIQTVVINSGEEAIRRLPGEIPDLVVLDLHMPCVNGVDVLRFIRGHEALKNLPVIVFSNGYVKELVEEVGTLGAKNIFAKLQCKPKQLVEEIEGVLAGQADSAEMERDSELDVASRHLTKVLKGELPRFIELLDTDPRPQARRVCLVHINKIMHDAFQCALAADETLPRGQLGRMLKTLLNDLYNHPGHVSDSTTQTLTQGLNKLVALCEEARGKLNSETALKDMLDEFKD